MRATGLMTTLAALLAVLIAINLIGSAALRNAKLDLTEEKLYTLSAGTKEILGELDHPVTLKFFHSKRATTEVPQLKFYASRVLELLKQYEAAAGGQVRLETYEPRPDTEVEEMALQYGIQSVGQLGDEPIYFGLAVVSETGREETMPYVAPQREQFLEYDITRLVDSVSRAEKQTLGVMTKLNVMGNQVDPMMRMQGQQPTPPWAFIYELQNLFEVQTVAPTAETIDDAIDVLMVIHPSQLGEATQYAIDQFVMRGGRLMVLVDPLSMIEQMNFNSPDPNARFQATFDSNLETLLDAWGLKLVAGKVVADPSLATQVGGQRDAPVTHPCFLTLGPEQRAGEDLITANLEQLVAVHAGYFDTHDVEGLEREVLLHSTDKAGGADAFMLKLGGDPQQIVRDMEPAGRELPIAVKLTGTFPSAFPDGRPADPQAGEAEQPAADESAHLAKSREETTVVVFADVDMLADEFSVQKQNFFGQMLLRPWNDNLALMSNAVEHLMGSQALITLRTRGKSDRPFTVVQEMEREAQEQYQGELEMLMQRSQETQQRLNELQRGRTDENARTVLSAEQTAELEKLRDEQVQTKRRLREVRRNLREGIENLGAKIKFINIALVPAIVLLLGFLPGIWRSRRLRRGS